MSEDSSREDEPRERRRRKRRRRRRSSDDGNASAETKREASSASSTEPSGGETGDDFKEWSALDTGMWRAFRPDEKSKGTTRQGYLGLAILTLGLIAFTITGIFIFLPFLTPLLLALIFTSVSYPLYETILSRVGVARRGIASGLTCWTLVLLVFVPVGWVTWSLASQASIAQRSVEPFVQKLLASNALEHFQESEYKLLWDDVRVAFAALREADPIQPQDGLEVDPASGEPEDPESFTGHRATEPGPVSVEFVG
ncbi:MAG: hypothetical protein AAF517_21995, partial [Planctomycetota bacterium]